MEAGHQVVTQCVCGDLSLNCASWISRLRDRHWKKIIAPIVIDLDIALSLGMGRYRHLPRDRQHLSHASLAAGSNVIVTSTGHATGCSAVLLIDMLLTGTPIGFGLYRFGLYQGIGPCLLLTQTLLFSASYLLFFLLQRVAGPAHHLSQIGAIAGIFGSLMVMVAFDESPSTGPTGQPRSRRKLSSWPASISSIALGHRSLEP